MVLHDHSGLVVGAAAHLLKAGFDSNVAEATTMFLGLQFSVDIGVFPSVLEYDSFIVVSAVNLKETLLSSLGLVIGDIKTLLGDFPSCSVVFVSRVFVSRQANVVADTLTKFVLTLVSSLFWIDDFPYVLSLCSG
ncbi:hypothetical protein ACOSQ2_009794 [Xanthoceras sorbifolium]